jgi:hypothetical protein
MAVRSRASTGNGTCSECEQNCLKYSKGEGEETLKRLKNRTLKVITTPKSQAILRTAFTSIDQSTHPSRNNVDNFKSDNFIQIFSYKTI